MKMRLLAIETSCDETAVAVVDAQGDERSATFRVRGDALFSQAELHKAYGGVFPALAKREHAKNLVPLLSAALEEAELLHEDTQAIPEELAGTLARLLEREPDLGEQFLAFASETERPAIDAIAVTAGPGLEPALWVGVNFAKALSMLWNIPLVAVNHMEGHILAALAREQAVNLADAARGETERTLVIEHVELPLLALLVSGGHTELVLMRDWLSYSLIGQTRDDAVGEAFDKVARMLDLPYPGGPEVSRLSEALRLDTTSAPDVSDAPSFPRPMLNDATCDFSFAGLKTAVLYFLKARPEVSAAEKARIAREFEDAVADVLWKKTSRALTQSGACTLVVGGGVSANTHIRRIFAEKLKTEHPDVALRIPRASLATDNALMIALAGFYRASRGGFSDPTTLSARGSLPLAA